MNKINNLHHIIGLMALIVSLVFFVDRTAVAAPTFQAAGNAESGTGDVSPLWPVHQTGDIALLFVEIPSSPQNTNSPVNGTRLTVFWARAGINWAMCRALDPDNPAPAAPPAFAACLTGTINTMTGSLVPFTVEMICNFTDSREADCYIRVYQITATACNQVACVAPLVVPPMGYVEQRVVVTVAKCKDPTAAGPRFSCG